MAVIYTINQLKIIGKLVPKRRKLCNNIFKKIRQLVVLRPIRGNRAGTQFRRRNPVTVTRIKA